MYNLKKPGFKHVCYKILYTPSDSNLCLVVLIFVYTPTKIIHGKVFKCTTLKVDFPVEKNRVFP